MWVVMVIALPFILLGAAILAQALGLGQFVGRALVPNFVLGAVGALFLATGLSLLWKAYGGENRQPNRAARILRSKEDHGDILNMWLGMAFYLAFIGVLDYVFLFKGGRETPPVGWAVMGLFSLFGLAGVFIGARKTLEWFKYGSLLLYLDAPAQTGAKLGARLTVPDRLRPAASVTATLSCIAKVRSRAENDRSSFESDNTVWSESKAFAIQWAGAAGQVQMQFAIPGSRPATDLPMDGMLLENRAYHRWELAITADVPGIDLDRTFELQVARGRDVPVTALANGPVEIAPRSSITADMTVPRTASAPAATARANPITAAARRPSVMIQSSDIPGSWKRPARVIAGIIGTIILAWFFGLDKFFLPFTASQKNTWPAAVAGPFEMKPDEFQQALRLFASGVKLERHGDDVRVRVEKLRFVKVKSSDRVEYVELGAYLIHRPQGSGYRELAKWRDVDYRGTVAAAKAEDTLGPIEFSFRGNASQCAGGDCWLKLYAHVPLGVGSFRYENTAAVRFLFSSTR